MASPVTAHMPLRPLADAGADPRVDAPEIAAAGQLAAPALSFEQIYDEHLALVWRSLRRLGVRGAGLDDAIQEVFLVVHRRLGAFEGRSSVKTWIFGIVLRVARTCRRTAQRHAGGEPAPADVEDGLAQASGPLPDEHAEHNEAVRMLHELLEEIGDEKREVFILAELEQMTAQEISEATGISLSNVYGRLRAARREFEQAVARRRARDAWGSR
jgi:RNA polymerase sigma-70 factor, ECF subfamily